jgi:hypothetical protein
MGRDLGLGR